MVTRRTKTSVPQPPLRRTCGAMQIYHQLLESHPTFRAQQLTLEHATTAANRSAPVARAAPFKIAVVVHVVHSRRARTSRWPR